MTLRQGSAQTLEVHRPYPGVALLVTKAGSALLGAPADAFKATKAYCQAQSLPFPRVLVAPQELLAHAVPQFNPEFFLYDFLFVYGAAFKPELEAERLVLVVDPDQMELQKQALRYTLVGPSRAELAGYRDPQGRPLVDRATVSTLASVSEAMAIKKDGRPRDLDSMIETIAFGSKGSVALLGGAVEIERDGPVAFNVRAGRKREHVSLLLDGPVTPFATLAVPASPETPVTFGVKALGTRSGFDLSGPTTGLLVWLNGRAILYDGPVGTRYLLDHQGISFDDIDAVILSHCHEDHMGGFVELILSGHRPRVYTSEPIYRSALVKLASYFQRPEHEVASYVDYHRVTPGEPVEVLGATLEFFHTIHAIPALGVAASLRDSAGQTHRIQISGDTLSHEGLDKMRADGVIDPGTCERMQTLVPKKKIERALYLADVGEAIIHGHPKDWHGNPNRVLYYHCPDNERTRSYGHSVAAPGEKHVLIEPRRLHPATPGRLLHALSFLHPLDPAGLATLLFHGRSREAAADEVLRHAGKSSPEHDTFSVIVSGTASVSFGKSGPFALLRPGEFFGAIELVDSQGRKPATVKAETPMELFEIDARLLLAYVGRNGLDESIKRIWKQRPAVDSAHLFRSLDLAARNRVAGVAQEEHYAAGETIVAQGSPATDFFLLTEGRVTLKANGRELATLSAEQPDNFFGETSIMAPVRVPVPAVCALTEVRVLRLTSEQMRNLFQGDMGVRYALALACTRRDSSHDESAGS